jgi:hypothetical protein
MRPPSRKIAGGSSTSALERVSTSSGSGWSVRRSLPRSVAEALEQSGSTQFLTPGTSAGQAGKRSRALPAEPLGDTARSNHGSPKVLAERQRRVFEQAESLLSRVDLIKISGG